jgi:Leucine-rich repeat (LRR) protein
LVSILITFVSMLARVIFGLLIYTNFGVKFYEMLQFAIGRRAEMLKFWLILCVLYSLQNQITGLEEHYLCTKNPFKCVLKNFNSTEDINNFCQRKINDDLNFIDKYRGKDNVHVYKIEIIVFENVSITHLPSQCFSTFVGLNTLIARNVGIEELDDSQFKYLDNIREINLSHNRIKAIQPAAFSGIGRSISIIDLSHNQIKQFDEQVMVNILNTFYYYDYGYNIMFRLNHNEMEKVLPTTSDWKPNPSDNREQKLSLDLSNNLLKRITFKCDLEMVDLSSNQVSEIKPANIRSVVLQNNNLQYIDDFVSFLSPLNHVIELDISNNSFKTFKLETFADMKKLEKLSISRVGFRSIPFGLFGHLSKLRSLDISLNHLKELDLRSFLASNDLDTLNISGNELRSIYGIKSIRAYLPALRHIALEGNIWKCSDLAETKMICNINKIEWIEALHPVKNETNLLGISCMRDFGAPN